MKKHFIVFKWLLISIILAYSSFILAVQSSRNTIKDISYRSFLETDTDTYIKNRSKLDISYPVNKSALTTIIYFYGGSLTYGDKSIPAQFSTNDVIVVAPNYRLSPLVKHPAYIEDAAAAVAWTFKHIAEYGGDPRKIYLSGYSAGAYLANMLYFDKNYLNAYDLDPDSLEGFFSFSGQMTTHFTVLKESGINASSDTKIIDQFSALYNVRPTKKPIVFYTGDQSLDMSGRYEQNLKMSESLKKLGNNQVYYIEFDGKDHTTMADPSFRNAMDFIRNPVTYQDTVLNSSLLVRAHDTLTDTLNQSNKISFKIADHIVYVSSEGTIKNISLLNFNGDKMRNLNPNSTNAGLKISDLSKGAYIISVTTSIGTYTKKILIK